MDDIVPFSQSEALVKKLSELNKVHEFVHFPDEGHGIKKHNNKLQKLIIQEEFLKKYVTDCGIQAP